MWRYFLSLQATVQSFSVTATSGEREMLGLLLSVLSVLLSVEGVPPRSRDQCSLPPDWEDIWTEARDGGQVSQPGWITVTISLLWNIEMVL